MTIAIVRKHSNNITMEGPASSINSRATAIRTILLAAWQGKLSNEEWEARIRKVLPRGVNGDVYDLADCLLKQALIGPVPNQLFMSYIRHAVQCELVSHSAVLRSIANQQINLRSSTLLYRTSPIVCLLEFLKAFRNNISCRGTEVECLNLCHSLSELLHWLLRCVSYTIEYINSSGNSMQLNIGTATTNSANSGLNTGSSISSSASSSVAAGMGTNNSTGSMSGQQLITNVPMSNQGSNTSVNNNTSSQLETCLGIIDLCTETICYFINRPFTKSLLFINKVDNTKEFESTILSSIQELQQKLSNCRQLQYMKNKLLLPNVLKQMEMTFDSKELHPSMVAAQQLRYLQTHRIRSTQITSSSNFERRIQQYNSNIATHDSSTNYALFNSLYPLVAFDAILRPARLNKHLARQIVTITNFNSAPVNMTYCELIRVCLIGLVDSHGNSKAKASWSFFTFLKLPRLLVELSRMFKKVTRHSADPNQATIFINDLKQAFERLCEYSPLLDEAESKCNCDLFRCLIKEIIKTDPSLMPLKNLDFKKFSARRPPNLTNTTSPNGGQMMLKTEPVVTSMLETLNSEQDPADLFGILAQACSGISFEYTLSAAAATGRLHLFVERLIGHNELYKLPLKNSSNPRNVQAQAWNFDITFLILTYTAQRYGSESIERNPANNATFNKWYHERYNQEASFNCPKEMLKDCNDEIVTSLIRQLVSKTSDVQMKSVNWHEVCINLPKALSEIMNAWIVGTLADEDIALVLERLKTRMCFMAVVAATWLQCYIKTLDEEDKKKPLHFLNCLAKSQPKHQHESDSESPSDGFKERSSLASAIIKRMHFELVPSSPVKGNRNAASALSTSLGTNSSGTNGNCKNDGDESQHEAAYHSQKDRFISTLTTQEIFIANVKQCLARGWMDYNSLNSLHSLFKIIGSKCFTNLIVEQILVSHESPSDLSRAVNITFGLFHLDIEACAFALLKDVIPSWLIGEKRQMLLNQPRAFALANLAVMTIIEVYDNLVSSSSEDLAPSATSSASSAPSNFHSVLTNDHRPLNGIIKQEPGIMGNSIVAPMHVDSVDGYNGPKDAKRMKLSHESSSAGASSQRDPASVRRVLDTTERLSKLETYIADLMRLFKEIMSDPVMSHRTLFPVLFLQQTVICAREKSDIVTVNLQPDIVLDIIDLFSSELSFELVLAMSNMSSKNGRKYTAKAMCKLAEIKESKQNKIPQLPPVGPTCRPSVSGDKLTMPNSMADESHNANQMEKVFNLSSGGKMSKSASGRTGGESNSMIIG